jgi:hypothetical protein
MADDNFKHKRYKSVHTFFCWRITYQKISVESLKLLLKDNFFYSKFSVEKGKKGQLHYQGYTKAQEGKRKTLKSVCKVFKDNIENIMFPKCDYCEGMNKNSWSGAVDNYVCKEDTHVEGPFEIGKLDMVLEDKEGCNEFDLRLEDLPEPYEWQKRLLEFHKGPPELFHRKIYWYWDPRGDIGKTMLARWLHLREGALYCQGADRHVIGLAYKNPAWHYVFGLARYDKVDYKCLEKLSDGIYMAGFGTENLGMVCRKTPWIICLANFPPCKKRLSSDRWVIKNIAEEEELYDLSDFSGLVDSDED